MACDDLHPPLGSVNIGSPYCQINLGIGELDFDLEEEILLLQSVLDDDPGSANIFPNIPVVHANIGMFRSSLPCSLDMVPMSKKGR